MSFKERVKQHFSESIQTIINSADSLTDVIDSAGRIMVESILNGGKILICANGSSTSDSKRLATYLINQFEIERPSLPAIQLSTDISIISRKKTVDPTIEIFSKQVYTLGQTGDILFVLSTNEYTENIINAIQIAHDKALCVIALTNDNCTNLSSTLFDTDIEICVPSKSIPHTETGHAVIINCLCDIIDQSLFGGTD